jgi:hypothetical protein
MLNLENSQNYCSEALAVLVDLDSLLLPATDSCRLRY